MHQLYVCLSLPSWASLSAHAISHPSMSSQSTELSSLCYIAGFHYLFYTWQCTYVKYYVLMHVRAKELMLLHLILAKRLRSNRIDAFELHWRRLLRVPWTARRSNQSILKEINYEYSLLIWLVLKLKLQYFGHWWEELTHWKRPWCRERLRVGGEGDDRGRDG